MEPIKHTILKVRPAAPPKTKEQQAYNNFYKKLMTDPVYGFSAKAPFDPYKPKPLSTWNTTRMKKGRKARRTRRNNRR